MYPRFPFFTAVGCYLDAVALRTALRDSGAPSDLYAEAFDHTVTLACVVDDCVDVARQAGSWPEDTCFWSDGGGL